MGSSQGRAPKGQFKIQEISIVVKNTVTKSPPCLELVSVPFIILGEIPQIRDLTELTAIPLQICKSSEGV